VLRTRVAQTRKPAERLGKGTVRPVGSGAGIITAKKTSTPSAGIRPRPAKEQELVRAAKFYKEETLQCKGVPPASERESIQSMKLTDSVQGSGARGASAPLKGSVAVNGNNPTKAGLLAGIQWLESTGE